MNLPAMEDHEMEEIIDLLRTSESNRFQQEEIWDRIGSGNELSMAYALFQSFLEPHGDEDF